MTPLQILAILILAATLLCLNAHDRMHKRRARSDNRLARLCKELWRTLDDTEEDLNR